MAGNRAKARPGWEVLRNPNPAFAPDGRQIREGRSRRHRYTACARFPCHSNKTRTQHTTPGRASRASSVVATRAGQVSMSTSGIFLKPAGTGVVSSSEWQATKSRVLGAAPRDVYLNQTSNAIATSLEESWTATLLFFCPSDMAQGCCCTCHYDYHFDQFSPLFSLSHFPTHCHIVYQTPPCCYPPHAAFRDCVASSPVISSPPASPP